MSIWDVIQIILITLVVFGAAWTSAHKRSFKHSFLLGIAVTLVTSLLFSLHRLWPTEFVADELSRSGNTSLYVTWNVKYFFIDFIPRIITIGILVLAASAAAWLTSVRFGKPKWLSVTSGIIVAVVLLLPAIIAGISALTVIIPGSWP